MTTVETTVVGGIADQDLLDRIIAEETGRPGALLGIRQRLQDVSHKKYLPMDILEYVAQRTGIPQSQVFSVASFYALFSLDPQGDHIVAICRGTACHTRGSRPLLERVELQLGLRDTESEGGNADKVSLTTPDLRFTPAIPEEVEAAEHEGAKLAYLVEEGDLVPGTRWPACARTSRCRPARTLARST